MSNLLPLNTRVRVIEGSSASERYYGQEGTISGHTRSPQFPYRVSFDHLGDSGHWSREVLEVTEEPPVGPTIDFSDEHRDRSRARAYAADADSRILPPSARKVLQAAARGEEVSALALNSALTHAMSAAATRYGQSMQRRDLTRKVRHLAYIVQGVLANHAAEIPPYEGGPRSPRIAELEREVAHSTKVNQSLAADLTEARAKVESLTQTVLEVREQVERAEAREGSAQENLIKTDEAWHAAEARAERAERLLDYAMRLMEPAAQYQVHGFADCLDIVEG